MVIGIVGDWNLRRRGRRIGKKVKGRLLQDSCLLLNPLRIRKSCTSDSSFILLLVGRNSLFSFHFVKMKRWWWEDYVSVVTFPMVTMTVFRKLVAVCSWGYQGPLSPGTKFRSAPDRVVRGPTCWWELELHKSPQPVLEVSSPFPSWSPGMCLPARSSGGFGPVSVGRLRERHRVWRWQSAPVLCSCSNPSRESGISCRERGGSFEGGLLCPSGLHSPEGSQPDGSQFSFYTPTEPHPPEARTPGVMQWGPASRNHSAAELSCHPVFAWDAAEVEPQLHHPAPHQQFSKGRGCLSLGRPLSFLTELSL